MSPLPCREGGQGVGSKPRAGTPSAEADGYAGAKPAARVCRLIAADFQSVATATVARSAGECLPRMNTSSPDLNNLFKRFLWQVWVAFFPCLEYCVF